MGEKLNEKQRRNFQLYEEWALDGELAALDFTMDDIDIVILTHMDWDHASGGTRFAGNAQSIARIEERQAEAADAQQQIALQVIHCSDGTRQTFTQSLAIVQLSATG